VPEGDRRGLKRAAAERALQLVRPGLVLGLGSGTTAELFIERLGSAHAAGLAVEAAVPTSLAGAKLAASLGLPVVDDPGRPIDLAVDGADEIDPELGLVKGRGGALFREKMVAAAARRFVVIGDDSKLVDRLGRTFLPVEVAPFLWRETAGRLAGLCGSWTLRGGEGAPYRTDNGNLIVDLRFPAGIEDPPRLAAAIKATTGVLEHGLFLGLATAAIVAGDAGIRELGSL
jgi:ribose 5-phosphate isomerase A